MDPRIASIPMGSVVGDAFGWRATFLFSGGLAVDRIGLSSIGLIGGAIAIAGMLVAAITGEPGTASGPARLAQAAD